MSQPLWITNAGSLGVYPSGVPLSIQLQAGAVSPAVNVRFELLNGTLPEGIDSDPVIFSSTGLITGTPKDNATQIEYTFTIRAIDTFGNIKDRTFSVSIFAFTGVSLLTRPGTILTTFDSLYVHKQIEFSNPVSTNNVLVTISSGVLPQGLSMDYNGLISGWPLPPVTIYGSPTTRTYTFTVQLISDLGTDTQTYSIVVRNHQNVNPPNTRIPAILNKTPLHLPIPTDDPYYDYYLIGTNYIPPIRANEYFSFKIIGYDFDGNAITYQYGDLPPGLVGDPITGWITGTPTSDVASINDYEFSVNVRKASNIGIYSNIEKFYLSVTNEVQKDIVWTTPADLGSIDNGSISEIQITATSDSVSDLIYTTLNGELPPNMTLLENGMIVGRAPFQPELSIVGLGESSTFTFEVTAFSSRYPLVRSTREFTLRVYQRYNTPYENVYFKASTNLTGRTIINTLLNSEQIIPPESLYRPDDVYFGKATDVKFIQSYGVTASSIASYINATQKNHYNRKLILGPPETAIARDENNNILYEVVYSPILDNLQIDQYISVSKSITWPEDISLNKGDWLVNNTGVYTSDNVDTVDLSPGSIRRVYPASLINMNTELASNIVQNTDQRILPKWMTSQQLNGNTIGFIRAWVICYTLPGLSQTIVDNISTMWAYKLSDIDFTVDRYLIDKSATYNWNTSLSIPNWSNLPSATPAPDEMDFYDKTILFPQETILPNDRGQ